MTGAEQAEAAAALLRAYADREPIEPIIGTYPELRLSDAYAIQQEQVNSWTGAGRRVKGHKVGLTSRAMQVQLGVDQPDYGVLLDDMFFLDSAPIAADRFIQPRVEPEISFVLKKSLSGPGITVADAIQAVDFAIASLEIIDSRIRDWNISLLDTIADNASAGGAVLGSSPVRLTDIDLVRAGCVMVKNGEVVGTGAGGAVLGSPINALVWLANTVGRYGVSLEAGAVVMPGSLCGAVAVEPGDTVSAEFAGLGTVTTHFAKA